MLTPHELPATIRSERQAENRNHLIAWMATNGVTIPDNEFSSWRMVKDQMPGQIVGLDESRGIVRCTNGILCYIDRAEGPPFLGHYEWWQADKTPRKARGNRYDNKGQKLSVLAQLFEELEFQP